MVNSVDEMTYNQQEKIYEIDVDEIEENEELDDFELKRFSFNSYKIERSIRDILAWIKRGKIEVPPFQRRNVWTFNQSARFVESLLLGLPTPDLFMYKKVEKGEEKFILIDGFQRITTIRQFTEGIYRKSNGEEKKFKIGFRNSNWSGKTYSTLDIDDVDYFNDYSLKISVFDTINKTDKISENNLMTSIFERINTGSTTLTTQEIRHAVYFGDAVMRIEKFTENESFIKLTSEDSSKDCTRRNNEEFYLRLLTYYYTFKQIKANRDFFDDKNKIGFYSSKKIMLNNFLGFINTNHDNGLKLLDNLAYDINNTLANIYDKFNDAFYAYSLLREQVYGKVYEPFAEALTIVILIYGIPTCNKEMFSNVKRNIWVKFDETKETTKDYKEFFENTTALDNVNKRVNTLYELLYRED